MTAESYLTSGALSLSSFPPSSTAMLCSIALAAVLLAGRSDALPNGLARVRSSPPCLCFPPLRPSQGVGRSCDSVFGTPMSGSRGQPPWPARRAPVLPTPRSVTSRWEVTQQCVGDTARANHNTKHTKHTVKKQPKGPKGLVDVGGRLSVDILSHNGLGLRCRLMTRDSPCPISDFLTVGNPFFAPRYLSRTARLEPAVGCGNSSGAL